MRPISSFVAVVAAALLLAGLSVWCPAPGWTGAELPRAGEMPVVQPSPR